MYTGLSKWILMNNEVPVLRQQLFLAACGSRFYVFLAVVLFQKRIALGYISSICRILQKNPGTTKSPKNSSAEVHYGKTKSKETCISQFNVFLMFNSSLWSLNTISIDFNWMPPVNQLTDMPKKWISFFLSKIIKSENYIMVIDTYVVAFSLFLKS